MATAPEVGTDEHIRQSAIYPLVYIVLVNWNTAAYTLECLASLEELSYPEYQVVIVDNGSTDGSADVIASAYPHAELLRLPSNRGFTGANNRGFIYALEQGAAYVYLLNNDTFVAPDFLSAAVATAQSDPSIGVVGSKVLHADRPNYLQFAGARVNLLSGHSGRPFGYDEADQGQYDSVLDVDRVTGCAMLITRPCLHATGGFDDALFAFHEDVDLCLRARAAGFRIVMSPGSKVWHKGGGSLGGAASENHMYYSVRNGLMLVQIHKPASNPIFGLLRAGAIVGAHALQVWRGGWQRAPLRGIVKGACDYYRGITGIRPR